MKIWHIYARHYNFGDHALGLAVRDLFRQYFAKNAIFETVDTHKLWIDSRKVDEINRDADFILVGGGGLIHTFGLGGRAWMFHLPTSLVASVAPCIGVFGVGFNQFRTESQQLRPSVCRNLRAIQKQALFFSVRNDESKACLAQNGIVADEIADPGFFLDGNYPAPVVGRPYAIVQLAFDSVADRGLDRDRLMTGINALIDHIIARGLEVVLAPHCKPDIEISNAVRAASPRRDEIHVWDYYKGISDDWLQHQLGYYKHAEFVVGMRGHAQIIPAGMGVPFLTIANHRKHRDLAIRLGMSDYCVEIGDQLEVELPAKMDALLVYRKELRSSLLAQTAIMREHVATYLQDARIRFDRSTRGVLPVHYRLGRKGRSLRRRIEAKIRY
jgi:polysaccharide pyruvyl transferase WcaK-like protein